MIKKIFNLLKRSLRNHLDTILIIALIAEAAYLGFLIYEQKHQPQYLMQIPVDYWCMLDPQQQDAIVSTLLKYSKITHPDWSEEKILYFYENNNMFKILVVHGRVETRRNIRNKPETLTTDESTKI